MVGGGGAAVTDQSFLWGSGGTPPEFFWNFEPCESGSETVLRSWKLWYYRHILS